MKKSFALVAALAMFISLTNLPLAAAKERQGATVEVTMTDGSQVKGELLVVKNDALLVYDQDTCQGKCLDLQQVAQVKLLKKSKFLTGLILGLCVGLVIGLNPEKNVHIESYWSKNLVAFGFIGGIIGTIASTPEKFSLAGESFESVQQNLKRLKRYAREQDFEELAVPEFTDSIVSNPGAHSQEAQQQQYSRHRFRLLWSPGRQNSSGKIDFRTENGTFHFVNNASSKDTAVYPFKLDSNHYLYSAQPAQQGIGQLRLDYEMTAHFSLSLEIAKGNMTDYMYYELSYYSTDYARLFESHYCMRNEYSYTSLLLGLNWKPVYPSFARKHIVELGVAAGLAEAQVNLDRWTVGNSNPKNNFRDFTWSCKAHAAYDYFYTENFSLGVFIEYQYLQASFPSATFFNEEKEFYTNDNYKINRFTRPTEFTIPGHIIQLGGTAYGLRVGLRF